MGVSKNLDEEVRLLSEKINEDSPYKLMENENKKWMTAAAMGKLLGLKKTGRYWLIHKNFFRTEMIMGEMRVEISSFEKWYANQIKYHKVTGEEPGLELKKKSLSARDIAELLGLNQMTVYELIQKEHLETVIVDYWKRVPVDVFWEWYRGQKHYRTIEDRLKDKEIEEETMSMPEMAEVLGVSRHTIYYIIRSRKYAKYFECVMLGDQKRYKVEGFEEFLQAQDQYQIYSPDNDDPEIELPEKIEKVPEEIMEGPETSSPEEDAYPLVRETLSQQQTGILSMEEAARLAGVSKSTVSKWCKKEYFPSVKKGKSLRIPAEAYIIWLANR